MAKEKNSPANVIAKMRAIALDEPQSAEEAERELLAAGVDVGGFQKRLLDRVKRIQEASQLAATSIVPEPGPSCPKVRAGHYMGFNHAALLAQGKGQSTAGVAYFNQVGDESSEDDLRSLLDGSDISKPDEKKET